MKRIHSILILSFILAATLTTIVLAQKSKTLPMEARWKQVEQFAQQDLPESALKEVEAILAQAKKEQNSPEIIKAMVNKMRFILDRNPDETEKLIKEFEEYTYSIKNHVEKAIMYSMTAEMYYKYYENDQYKINKRTEIQGFVPNDIKEWTKIIFADKIVKLVDLSLLNPELLQSTNSLMYAAIMDLGNDSRDMQPTLFDFLSYRKIDLLKKFKDVMVDYDVSEVDMSDDSYNKSDTQMPEDNSTPTKGIEVGNHSKILDTYNQLIDFNRKQKNTSAVVYAELQKLKFEGETKEESYLKKLENLENEYAGNESLVEVLAAKATYYMSKHNLTDKNDDSNKKALEIVISGINNFPKYKRIGLLENIKKQLLKKFIHADSKTSAKPKSKFNITISTNNISSLQLSVYKVNATALEYHNFRDNRRDNRELYSKRTLVDTLTISIKSDPNLNPVSKEIEFTVGDYGIYEFVLEENKTSTLYEKAVGYFVTTDLSFIQRNSNLKSNDVFVLDRINGNPLKGVTMKVCEQTWGGSKLKIKLLKQNLTNAEGLTTISYTKDYEDYILFFEQGNDQYFTSSSDYYGNDFGKSTINYDDARTTALFTDRSLYRPGQILYFKGIMYKSKKQEVVPNETAKIELFNVNNEKVGEKTLKTNEFGSFSSEFVLPESGLNGAYRLQSSGYSINIWVEEYKRPTFEVTVNRPKEEVRFGEEVKVKGEVKAYAGYTIADATVKYKIVRRPHRFWWWHSEPEQIISNGTTTSGTDGTFEVAFVPKKGKTTEVSWWRGNNDQFYTYTVYADVTDQKGETQQGEQMVSVGDKSLFIIVEVPAKVEKSKPLILDVATQTLNGETVISTVKYSVVALQSSNVYYEELNDTSKLKELETVMSGTFETKEKLTLDPKKLTSGIYKIIFTTKDNRGNEVKEEKRFVLYDSNDKKPPVKTYSWLLTENTEVKVGEIAQLKFGTSTKNTSVLYELLQGKTILERRWIKFNNEIQTFNIPFKDTYGAGVTVVFTFVKDEKLFTQKVIVSKKVEEKKLTPTVSVFRDMLKPGEKADWTINIPQTSDKKIAELLIGMYDASLDALRPHNWPFNPTYREYVPSTPSWLFKGMDMERNHGWFEQNNKYVPEHQFDAINWFDLQLGEFRYYYKLRSSSEKSPRNVSDMQSRNLDAVAMEESVVFDTEQVSENLQKEAGNTAEKPIKVRENFNETAFFYPQLHTDKDGNVKVTFTAPESLTRWNVKMLAHTTDLYFGQETMQVITQKELMVQMNLPRFVRRSDKLTLVANVVNVTDKAITTTVKLEIIDPENNQSIALQSAESHTITLGPKETKAVEWKLNELKDFDLVIAKVTAQSENFSDGEQKYLPVLPDKVLITESQAMTVRANQTRTFTFDSFVSQMKNVETKNFTIEFAGNPTWYAVQALPTLAEPTNENAIDYLTAYYSNKLAGYIANDNPKIAETFDRWKKGGGTRDALLSNLQKNQELKNMLLEETPWVMEAKDETEQKKQIALLFELNQQKNQSDKYLNKLLKLQTTNGGFRWFEKMPESRYITQEVLLNLARLNKMTKEKRTDREDAMVKKALNYLDLMIAKDFTELKKYNKEYYKQNVIHDLQLMYLHTRSEYNDIQIADVAKPAVDFYTAQSEKYWTSFTLYGKAMIATVAHRNGKNLVANNILKSLKENALKTDELGMYWAKNVSGWWWHERPIAVQTAMIEAFTEISKNNAEADEMKIWLLKQKQTQRWDTPISTVDAIYALLNYGTDWLSDNGSATIKLGNTTLIPQNEDAGTGYFKEEISVEALTPETGKITISKESSNGIGWGAAYWQYYQDLDKVKAHGKEMNVSKKLFVEKVTNGKKTMLPIEQTTLNKGDKVITRLVLTTDRNLEFVALKDLRASCFEPVNQTSGYQWRDGAGYYYTIKDASTQYFFDFLRKGTYVFEYEAWVNNTGTFTSGMTSVQCLYAPEFVSHTGGEKISVK